MGRLSAFELPFDELSLPCWDAALFSIIDEQVDIAWSVAEHSQQQGNLSAMVDRVIGRVVHEFSQRH